MDLQSGPGARRTSGAGSPGDGSSIFSRSQTNSDFSETSSMSESRHFFDDGKKADADQSNIPMTSFNFINSIIGSGIIGIPFALKQAGFGLGIIFLILVAIITDYSLILLIEAGKLSNTVTYQDMMLFACGRPGFYLLSALQFLYPFIAMISYNVIIGDTITKIITRIGGNSVEGTVLANRQFIIFLSTIVITLPLSLYRNIAKLSKWAFVSLVLVLFILICICIKLGTFAKDIPPTPNAWSFANTDVTQAIGIMAFAHNRLYMAASINGGGRTWENPGKNHRPTRSYWQAFSHTNIGRRCSFAYMCHHSTFLIHASLENPAKERWNFVTHVSVLFCMVVMLVFGLVGYASFTGYTQGDLLENYCHEDNLMSAARFIFAVTVMLTYPTECFVTREVIEHALFPNSQPAPLWRHIVVSLVIVLANAALSMTTDCLGIVLELNGVLAACPLAFIIPPVCVMRLRQEPIFSKSNIIPILIATFGTLVAIIGFIMAIYNFSEGSQCSHGKEMEYCLMGSLLGSNMTTPASNFTLRT